MAKVFIEETTLTAIGDAIREKTGSTDLIAPGNMPTEIKSIVSGGGSGDGDCNGLHVPEEALVISGDCQYRFAHNGWNWFINNFKDYITTKDISSSAYMFYTTTNLDTIPFAINFKSGSTIATNFMFSLTNASFIGPLNNLKPTNMQNMFSYCRELKELPVINNWDWSGIDNATSAYTGQMNGLFLNCYRLRTIPQEWLSHVNPQVSYSYHYPSLFENCYSLETLENISVPTGTTWTTNAFNKTFTNCYRLKKFTFAMQQDGTPYAVKWKNQTIDLTTAGFSKTDAAMVQDTDFTIDTKIDSVSKWRDYVGYPDQGLPGRGDGWASDRNWSVFGKSATVNLINSLPDASAYLASSGGTNAVKLNSMAAYNVTYECIGDYLTEEEIAVAAAKGWTISLT